MALNNAQIISFDVLMFLAILLAVLALVPPIFSRHVVRRKTWHNMLLASLVFSIAQVLLIGNQTNEKPNPVLCLVQVSIITAAPTLYAFSMASYTADIYFSIRHMFKSDDFDGPEQETAVFLVLAPWVVFLLVFLEAILVLGVSPGRSSPFHDPHLGLYCRTENNATILVSTGLVLLAGLCAFTCQAATGVLLYRDWLKIKNESITSTVRKYINAFARTLAFTVVALLGVILGIVATSTRQAIFTYSILLPLLPITTTLIFGTYMDILSYYAFWR